MYIAGVQYITSKTLSFVNQHCVLSERRLDLSVLLIPAVHHYWGYNQVSTHTTTKEIMNWYL
jgi:hypothetical protein